MAEQHGSSETEILDDYVEQEAHHIGIGVPLGYMEGAVMALIEMVLNIRSEGKRVAGETEFTTKSLQKLTRQVVLLPDHFSYEAISDDLMSAYFANFAKEIKDNIVADSVINSDKIFINFYYNDDGTKDKVHVWETWTIDIVINPTKTLSQVVRDLNYLASVIPESPVPPVPHSISLRQCKRRFTLRRESAWVYRSYIRQGSSTCSDHILRLTTDLENIGKILTIVFETILYFRCISKLNRHKNGGYKIKTRPSTYKAVTELGIIYPRICCRNLMQLIKSRVDYCLSRVQNMFRLRKFAAFYLSFYRLKKTEDGIITRKICERWQIACQIKTIDMSLCNLPNVLSYIELTKFPDSLRVSHTLPYRKLYKHYFTKMAACTPPRFYIHT